MSVGADKAAVKADIARRECRDAAELCREEILLCDAVCLMEILHDGELDLVRRIVVRLRRLRTDENVHLFRRNTLHHALLHLISCKMDEQVGDDKQRIIRLVTNADRNGLNAVVGHTADNTAQFKRNSRPLILFDAAVVMRLEECHPVVLIERHHADIDARRIQMGGSQIDTGGKRLFADYSKYNSLVTIHFVILVARFDRHAARVRFVAAGLRLLFQIVDCVALGLSLVEKFLVALGVAVHGTAVVRIHAVPAGLFVIKQFVIHNKSSFPARILPEQTMNHGTYLCAQRVKITVVDKDCVTARAIPLVVVLCIDAQSGILLCNAVARHNTLNADLTIREDADGHVADRIHARFKQHRCIINSDCPSLTLPFCKGVAGGLSDVGVRDRIQLSELIRIGKYNRTECLSVEITICKTRIPKY